MTAGAAASGGDGTGITFTTGTVRARGTTGPGGGTPASFSGSGSEFAGILLRGVFLQLLTFGFYRFWLITQIRRHLWSNTRIGGESLEYTGTAKELLIGFLIALAILVPVYILYAMAGLVAESMQAFASIPLILVLYCLGYYAAYRARRYRATRTLFRGLRFWMTGSGWSYLARASLWDIATLLTLGLAYPWRKAALERYLMRNTLYGTLKGDFVGTGGSLFVKLAPLWLIAILVVGYAVSGFVGNSGAIEDMRPEQIIASVFLLPIVLPVVFAMSLAIVLRWRLNGIRIGDAALVSRLPILTVLGCSLLFMLALFAFGIVIGIVAAIAVAMGAVMLNVDNLDAGSIILVAAIGLFYIWTLLSIGAIKRYFIERGVWRAAAGTVTVTNLDSIEAAVAAGMPASSLGEGLADALDMGF